MLFSKDFLDLNLKFARRVSEVIGQNFRESLLEYTHLYLAFGLGRDFDPLNPIWRSYLHQLKNELDEVEYTHRFYLEQKAKQTGQKPENQFGCFSYALWDDNRVRLHFHNATKESGILQKQKAPERVAELKAMFESLKKIVPITSTVVGGSWLYNIEAYRRLFPIRFLNTAQVGDDDYQFIALWGQFLLHDGNVFQPQTQLFLERIEKQSTLHDLKACFPYQVLRLESPITDFYVCYGME
jgi:hypothetical protein